MDSLGPSESRSLQRVQGQKSCNDVDGGGVDGDSVDGVDGDAVHGVNGDTLDCDSARDGDTNGIDGGGGGNVCSM